MLAHVGLLPTGENDALKDGALYSPSHIPGGWSVYSNHPVKALGGLSVNGKVVLNTMCIMRGRLEYDDHPWNDDEMVTREYDDHPWNDDEMVWACNQEVAVKTPWITKQLSYIHASCGLSATKGGNFLMIPLIHLTLLSVPNRYLTPSGCWRR